MERTGRHDVVVVGGRCAGAAVALRLARAGHDVVVVDRSRFPSDTTSTHALTRAGVLLLQRWGVLDEVLDSGAPPIRQVTFETPVLGDEVVTRPVRTKAGVDFLLAPRRHALDDVLLRAAERAGATVLTGTTVEGVLRDDEGRVAGVVARDATATPVELRARLVVGADGRGSRLARWVGARLEESYAPSGGCLYAYVADVPWAGFEFHLGREAFAGVFTTHDDQACVWLLRPEATLAPVMRAGRDRCRAWLATLLETAPGLGRRVAAGRVVGPVRGAARLPNHLRRPVGPGWALVGDAGYHRDPITGHGMTDAFRDAELLADALGAPGDVLGDPAAERVALAGFHAERNRAVADVFALTRAIGGFPPPPEFLDLQSRLAVALDAEAMVLADRPAPVHHTEGRRP